MFRQPLRQILLLLVLTVAMLAPRQVLSMTEQFDIVVSGGSFSAPAAALAAARANPSARVLLIEPTDWLGGQATSQGVSAIDNTWFDPGASLMRNNPPLYYPADYLDFIDRMKNMPAGSPGTGMGPNGTSWVSREAYDPRSGAWVLDQMIAEAANITVWKLAAVKAVQTEAVNDEFGAGRRITGLTVIRRTPVNGYKPFDRFLSGEILDWYNPSDSDIYSKETIDIAPVDATRGMVVIDASELADVVVLSGATYTVGRELTSEAIADDGTIPPNDEDGSQAFVYCFAVTDAPAPNPETELKAPWPDFDTYYAQQSSSYYSLGNFTWARIWTYRRLLNTGAPFQNDAVNRGDVSMQNWYPGNDYPNLSMYKNRTDSAAEAAADWYGGLVVPALAEAEKHAMGWYFFYKERRTSSFDIRLLHGNDPLNMMDTKHGLAKFPYIRETRRIVGLHNFRITERYFVDTQEAGNANKPSFRYYDSVGIGNYANDVHPNRQSTGLRPSFERPGPFYIPYRSMGSVNVRNLLAGGKVTATTYITNSAYRLHPIEWVFGSAAGTAAVLMLRDGVRNYDLLQRESLRELQTIVSGNSPIHWQVYDAEPIPPYNGEIVANNLHPVQPGVPFRVEVYHHSGVRARLYRGTQLLGESTTRANGRLVFNGITSSSGTADLYADVFDAQGNLLDRIGAPAGERNLWVIDNGDAGFSTTGTWTNASAQANKFGANYTYLFGNGGAGSATWQLGIERAGLYEIAVWYPQAPNRASDSPFTVHHEQGATTIRINQQQTGGQWVILGEFRFRPDGDQRVVLSNDIADPTKLVVADAVRVRAISVGELWVVR